MFRVFGGPKKQAHTASADATENQKTDWHERCSSQESATHSRNEFAAQEAYQQRLARKSFRYSQFEQDKDDHNTSDPIPTNGEPGDAEVLEALQGGVVSWNNFRKSKKGRLTIKEIDFGSAEMRKNWTHEVNVREAGRKTLTKKEFVLLSLPRELAGLIRISEPANFEDCDFFDANFSTVDLSGANFTGANFISRKSPINFNNCTTMFNQVVMRECNFRIDRRFRLHNEEYRKNESMPHQFQNCSLNADFEDANFEGADFSDTKFNIGTNFTGTTIWNCSFSRANLRSVTFDRTDFLETKFDFADLSGANFSNSIDPELCNFFCANLNSVKFTDGIVFGGPFGPIETNTSARVRLDRDNVSVLSGANLIGAKLSGADLSKNLFCSLEIVYQEKSQAIRDYDSFSKLFAKGSRNERLASLYSEKRELPSSVASEDPSTTGQKSDLGEQWVVSLPPASLREANLRGAILKNANVSGCDLRESVWTDANVAGIVFDRSMLKGKCTGVGGISNTFGSVGFRTSVLEQEYFDSNELDIDNISDKEIEHSQRWWVAGLGLLGVFTSFVSLPPKYFVGDLAFLGIFGVAVVATAAMVAGAWVRTRAGRRFQIEAWYGIGKGQVVLPILLFASFLILLLGSFYAFGDGTHVVIDRRVFEGDGSSSPDIVVQNLYPWYVALMGFCTLGISDLVSPISGLGILTITFNVLMGFLTLGLLLAVLSDKLTRRG